MESRSESKSDVVVVQIFAPQLDIFNGIDHRYCFP